MLAYICDLVSDHFSSGTSGIHFILGTYIASVRKRSTCREGQTIRDVIQLDHNNLGLNIEVLLRFSDNTHRRSSTGYRHYHSLHKYTYASTILWCEPR